MRIAYVAPLATPVRREASGSIEGIVWLLSRELTALGHQVTVFAAAGSEPCGELVATLPGTYASADCPDDWQVCEWLNLCRAVEQSERFDVVHSHAYFFGLPLQALTRAPFVHTLHTQPTNSDVRLWELVRSAPVTALSRAQWAAHPGFAPIAVIHHGIDATQFSFQPRASDYICYLGRFLPGKGPLEAIRVARHLGLRLLLAGPSNTYYRERVQPLVDGKLIEYVGSVHGTVRDRLLGEARALLYPVQSPEPFGLVIAEAMWSGTPVAATCLGAAPELIDEGVTGFCAANADGYPEAVLRCLDLDRHVVRARAEQRFSAARMAREYVDVYERLVKRA